MELIGLENRRWNREVRESDRKIMWLYTSHETHLPVLHFADIDSASKCTE